MNRRGFFGRLLGGAVALVGVKAMPKSRAMTAQELAKLDADEKWAAVERERALHLSAAPVIPDYAARTVIGSCSGGTCGHPFCLTCFPLGMSNDAFLRRLRAGKLTKPCPYKFGANIDAPPPLMWPHNDCELPPTCELRKLES